jgi:hypothetical protein
MSFREVVLRSCEQSSQYSEVCPPRDSPEIAWLEPSCFAWISINNDIAVDYVCRTESIQTDVNAMCEILGLEPPCFPHLNATEHGRYVEYYDEETQEIVAQRYAKDIEKFGYQFGD